MANRSRVITVSPLDLNLEDALDLWEVVNTSDGEYSDDSFSVDSLSDDDVISLDDASLISPSVISPPPSPLPEMLVESDDGGDLSLAADLDLNAHVDDGDDEEFRDEGLGWAQRRMMVLRGGTTRYSIGITYGDFANRGGCVDDDDDGGEDDEDRGEDDGEYDDSYDLDEELVPRSFSKKFGKQRMKKLGKKSIARVPYSQLKSGCVRPGGKHGLGLKLRF